jgi:anti-sigma B factor antagonist
MSQTVLTSPPFELQVSHRGDVVVISVTGEIDVATAPRLAAALAQPADSPAIVVDLTNVEFLDSSGLNVLAARAQEASREGGRFRVVVPRLNVIRRVIEITNLVETLGIAETLDEAL